jgi:hypothetical protein
VKDKKRENVHAANSPTFDLLALSYLSSNRIGIATFDITINKQPSSIISKINKAAKVIEALISDHNSKNKNFTVSKWRHFIIGKQSVM